jgi:SAM-dependent methyltransferase
MLRAMAKGAMLAAFGRLPGGPRFYRSLTRDVMGTQATHVDKLKRVWPGYVEVWQSRCSLCLEGLDVWVHEGGWTPFAPLVNYLLTGAGGVMTNVEGHVLDRYLARAVNGVLSAALPACLTPPDRRRQIEAMRWYDGANEAITAVGGRVLECVVPHAIPLPTSSVDVCHSGGTLEHYPPHELAAFLSECRRILRPGGVASHVFDHRDHLHHADQQRSFLAHLALPETFYALLCGHPLLYHNRLTPNEVMRCFEAAGFEPIAVRRLILPQRRYADDEEVMSGQPGLPRKSLARRFLSISEEDLRTAAAHYLYRKPVLATRDT